jgi:hypothetical protein
MAVDGGTEEPEKKLQRKAAGVKQLPFYHRIAGEHGQQLSTGHWLTII